MKKIFILISPIIMLFGCNPKEIRHRPSGAVNAEIISMSNSKTMENTKSFYDFTVKTLDGKEFSMAQFKGKKVVVMNVASECGYTPQYADWEKFYAANKDKVAVIGMPCNQFGGQESGSHEEIKTFCQKNYGVTFPIAEKMNVKGADKSPLYAWLTTKAENGWNEKEPSWNFCKYLINEKGELMDFFASGIKPDNEAFLKSIAK
jgi:glutathione peroxidase